MIVPLKAGGRPLAYLAALLGSECPTGMAGFVPKRLVTNSREVTAGDLFCALRGRDDDGHHYIKEACERGAAAVLAEEMTDARCPAVLTKSTRRALGLWAKDVLLSHPCLRVGITGSVGKTTTKNAVAALLGAKHAVHATEGNLNNDLGLPFTVLSMPRETEILIAELGSNAPGEIAYLAEILRPHKAIITAIGHAHIGAFGSRDAIATEKAALFRATAKDGELFYMAGEPIPPDALLPPRTSHALVPLTDEVLAGYGLSVPRGRASINSLTFAYHLGKALGLEEAVMRRGLTAALALPPRATRYTIHSFTLIEDAYNASPESMVAALEQLKAERGRRVALLGTMQELGDAAWEHHLRIGAMAAKSVDLLLAYGAFAPAYLAGAATVGKRDCASLLTDKDPASLAHTVLGHLKAGDTVLFKASRAERADEVCKLLLRLLRGDPL